MYIREGKGKKDRVVPIGERALDWLQRYRDEVRPLHVVEPDPGTLFLTRRGQPLATNRLTELVHRYVTQAGLGKTGSCHLFRHTMATLMLENGADMRYLQALLGHADLSNDGAVHAGLDHPAQGGASADPSGAPHAGPACAAPGPRGTGAAGFLSRRGYPR